MSWSTAHRVAHIAAVQARHELQVSSEQFPVPVNVAIERAGVTLMWRPLDRLFGTYLRVGDTRGILVNERLTRSGRRHTAAHELGHHRFGHRVDPGSVCAFDTGDAHALPQRWTPDEQAAEAFADWFLMPPKAVRAALACLNLERPDGPASVYQLSLLLGTTYRATLRHCLSLRLVCGADRQAWSKITPGTLKQRLLDRPLPSTRDIDVWSLVPSEFTPASTFTLSPGDTVALPRWALLDAEQMPTMDNGPDQVLVVAPSHGHHVLRVVRADGEVACVRLVVESRPHGLHIPGNIEPSTVDREANA